MKNGIARPGANTTQPYERRPRAAADAREAAQNDKKGIRTLLPVRDDKGGWARRTAKRKRGKNQPGDSLSSASPSDSTAGPKKGGQKGAAAQEAAANANLTTDEKRAAIAKLAAQLLQAPHKHIALFRDLHQYAQKDPAPMIQRLALMSEVAVLCDLIPAYRIRLPTEKELATQVSADVTALRAYEKAFLSSYESAVSLLRRWLRFDDKCKLAAVRGLAALLGKGRDFNCRDAIVGALVPVCNWHAPDAARDEACKAFEELFAADTVGEAALLAVQQMSSLLRTSSLVVQPQMLRCWLQLKLDAARPVDEATRRAKKRRRSLDPLAKELALAEGERGDASVKQNAVLEQVFVTYARVIKKCPSGPLLPIVLQGVAKFAHQVNVELLLDLFANLRAMLRDEELLPPASALLCVHALLRLLSGHGQALAVDTKDVQIRLYSLLSEPEVLDDAQLLATGLDCLEHLCKQRANLLAPRVAAFILKLLSAALLAPHAHAAAMLCTAARLLAACPRAESILHAAEGSAARAQLTDPDSPATLQVTAWQLAALQRHYHPPVVELARAIATQAQLPSRFTRAAPLHVMRAFSAESGTFNPRPRVPAAIAPRKAALPTTALDEVRRAAADAHNAAGATCTLRFAQR